MEKIGALKLFYQSADVSQSKNLFQDLEFSYLFYACLTSNCLFRVNSALKCLSKNTPALPPLEVWMVGPLQSPAHWTSLASIKFLTLVGGTSLVGETFDSTTLSLAGLKFWHHCYYEGCNSFGCCLPAAGLEPPCIWQQVYESRSTTQGNVQCPAVESKPGECD